MKKESTLHKNTISIFKTVTFKRYFLYAVSSAIFLGTWHILGANNLAGLVTPTAVIQKLHFLAVHKLAGNNLWGNVWASFKRILVGYGLGAITGIPLGLFMALNSYVRAITKPVFDLFKPMPPLAWIAIAILWFGIGEASKDFIIFVGAFVPFVLNSYNGIRIIDEELYQVVKMLGGNRTQEIFSVSFPASLPAIFAGFQIALSISWTCVLAAELVSARSGLGFLIIMGMNLNDTATILSGMVCIAIVAFLTTIPFTYAEKILIPWKQELE